MENFIILYLSVPLISIALIFAGRDLQRLLFRISGTCLRDHEKEFYSKINLFSPYLLV